MTPEEREIQLRERLERIESLEQEVKKREMALKAREGAKKTDCTPPLQRPLGRDCGLGGGGLPLHKRADRVPVVRRGEASQAGKIGHCRGTAGAVPPPLGGAHRAEGGGKRRETGSRRVEMRRIPGGEPPWAKKGRPLSEGAARYFAVAQLTRQHSRRSASG